MKKFDLAISSAPLGASFLLLEHIQSLEKLIHDVLLTIALVCFVIVAFIAAFQIHRYSQAIGMIRSGLAQSDMEYPSIQFRLGFAGQNIFEFVLLFIGYAIIVFFLILEIWELA